jgi:hypothetical protein
MSRFNLRAISKTDKKLHAMSDTSFSVNEDKGYFVNAAVDASGDGLSWDTAFKTILEAAALARDDYSDDASIHIFIAPGTYVESEDIRLYGHGIHLIGLGHPGTDSGVNMATTAHTYAQIMLAGANCTIKNIQFNDTVDKPGLWLLASDNSVIDGLKFKGTTGTTTTAMKFMDVRSTEIKNCQIGEANEDYTNGMYIEGGADYYCIDSHIHDNRMASNDTGAKGILIDNTSVTYNNVFEGNTINLVGAGATAIGIDNNSTNVSIYKENTVVVDTSATPIESASSPSGILHNWTMAGSAVVDPNAAKS